ncbi:MAG TPA: hypothetical protein VFL92_08845, partial [Sphingomonas sp.]|nr:hypothetical protein [Sphingomonas sp.]
MNQPFRPKLPNEVPGADKLAPGEARCPGPSVQDILEGDVNPAPPILREEHYAFLGDQDIGYERYYDQR